MMLSAVIIEALSLLSQKNLFGTKLWMDYASGLLLYFILIYSRYVKCRDLMTMRELKAILQEKELK